MFRQELNRNPCIGFEHIVKETDAVTSVRLRIKQIQLITKHAILAAVVEIEKVLV